MLAYLLIVLGLFSRLIIHTPNFNPLIAIALFSGIYVSRKYAVILPLASMVISDLFLGIHNVMAFTWGSILIIALMGLKLREHKSFKNVFLGSLSSAVIFFVATNFGVWLMTGMYTYDLSGLVNCFVMAIPFFRSSLASTLIYTVVLYGIYEAVALRVKNTRFASVL